MASESLLNQLRQSFYNADGTQNERLTRYCSQQVQKITIDGNTFTGYKTYSFFWEKTYVKEPERSSAGVITNLNSYATFITPHLQINFSMMSMEDYRRLYELIMARNEYVVTCYNPLTNETTTNKMYFYPDSLPKLNMIARNIMNPSGAREKWVELLGVQDYTIEMVGTNAQLGGVVVTYLPNPPSDVSSSLTGIGVDVENGQEILVGSGAETIMNATFTGYVFQKWNTMADGSGVSYGKNNLLTVTQDTTLYAIWTASDTYTLSYNYGQGDAQVDEYGNKIYSKQIKKTDKIGFLYESSTPSVTFDGSVYTPYIRKGWYRTPTIGFDTEGNEDTPLTADDIYGVSGNSTIYQIYAPLQYILTFNSNGGTTIDAITAEYNSSVAIPIPKKDGYAFSGWYYDNEKFEKPFSKIMPPVSKALYAKWSKVE